MRRVPSRKRLAPLQHTPAQDRWLLSYADFVTLLFAVFVVLFAFAWQRKQPIKNFSSVIQRGFQTMGAHPDQSGEPAEKDAAAEEVLPPPVDPTAQSPGSVKAGEDQQLYDQLHAILGNSIERREVVMRETPEGLVISLRELGFFASGEAALLPGAADKIAAAAVVLKDKGFAIRVEGHSDDQPIHSAQFRSNWELSIARAMSVLRLLVEEASFPEERISAAGYGSFRPIASNETPEGRRQNRRVDLVVLSPPAKTLP